MNQEGILFQFAFGELINSYMALFLAGRRVEAKDEQDWEKLFPRRQELITPDNISPALMVWDLYLEEIEPDLGSLHLYAFQLRFKASLANFPVLNCSNSQPLAIQNAWRFPVYDSLLLTPWIITKKMLPNQANLLILQHFI